MNDPKSQNKIYRAIDSKAVGITETEVDPICHILTFSAVPGALDHL